MVPVKIGEAGEGRQSPVAYVTVQDGQTPMLRVDLYEGHPAVRAFQDVQVWGNLLVVGFGAHLHLISLVTRIAQSVALHGYFGHLYALPECLLVTDAVRLHCFDRAGALLRKSVELGIDGVIVRRVEDGIIEGKGEWDPPAAGDPFEFSSRRGNTRRTDLDGYEKSRPGWPGPTLPCR
jgi:hypothetical protein